MHEPTTTTMTRMNQNKPTSSHANTEIPPKRKRRPIRALKLHTNKCHHCNITIKSSKEDLEHALTCKKLWFNIKHNYKDDVWSIKFKKLIHKHNLSACFFCDHYVLKSEMDSHLRTCPNFIRNFVAGKCRRRPEIAKAKEEKWNVSLSHITTNDDESLPFIINYDDLIMEGGGSLVTQAGSIPKLGRLKSPDFTRDTWTHPD